MAITIDGTDGISPLKASGQTQTTTGTAAAPAISSSSDTDSGIFFGTNEVKISTGGTQRATVDSSGDLLLDGGSDVRIELGTNGTTATNDRNHLRGDGDNLKYNCCADGTHIFEQNGTEKMRIASNGRVGIGVSSPTTRAHLDGTDNGTDNVLFLSAANLAAGAGGKIAFGGNYDGTNRTSWADIKGSKESATSGEYGGYLSLSTRPGGGSNTERIRITSGGVVAVNRTAALHGGVFVLDYTNGTSAGLAIKDTQTSGTGVVLHVVNGSGTVVGGISQNQSTTSFNTSSDYRLKENVVDITDGIARVKQLQPRRFNFIANDTTTVDGFVAHEAQTVVPEAVTGTHNEVDDDNNPVYQGIDQSKLVPLLTAALKEAIGKIETLETQNADLLARVTALEAA